MERKSYEGCIKVEYDDDDEHNDNGRDIRDSHKHRHGNVHIQEEAVRTTKPTRRKGDDIVSLSLEVDDTTKEQRITYRL